MLRTLPSAALLLLLALPQGALAGGEDETPPSETEAEDGAAEPAPADEGEGSGADEEPGGNHPEETPAEPETDPPAPAHTGPSATEHAEEHAEEHGEAQGVEHGAGHHYRFVVAATGAGLAGMSEGHAAFHGGGGMVLEGVIHPKWLELALTVKVLSEHGGAAIPISLLLTKPFHATSAVHPFLGIGPLVSLAVHGAGSEGGEHEEAGAAHSASRTEVVAGFEAVAGSHFWLASHFGLVAEASYGLLFAPEGPTNELGGSAGVVFGF